MVEYFIMVEDKEKREETELKPVKGWKRPSLKKMLFVGLAAIVALVLLGSVYIYAVSPAAIRNPQMDHIHFRMQLVVGGQDVDFGLPAYQTPYDKNQCSADLPTLPIHFHDQKNQFVHLHWANITGGMVLKNYGWNFMGGGADILGYRLDDLPRVKSVPIHGRNLPNPPSGARYWVYAGDANGYQKRQFNDFKNQDVEKFFGRESNFPAAQTSLIDRLFPKAYAHGSESHANALPGESEEERLTRINNLIGNVVIFVQKNEPDDAQIKDKFAHLEPLSDSTCGG